MNKNIRTTIIYPHIMYYRKPIFSYLANYKDGISFSFLADEKTNLDALPVLKHNKELIGETLFNTWTVINNIWFGKHILWQWGLVRHALFGSYDILILLGSMYYISNWVAVLVAKMKKKKVLMWTHGVRGHEKGVKGAIRKYFYNLSDGLLLYGNSDKEILKKDGLEAENMHVIYNSLDFDLQQKVIKQINSQDIEKKRKSLGVVFDEKVIICICRLTPNKNVPLLLDVLKILDSEKIKTRTIIIGDGPDRDKLVVKAKELNISKNIIMYGPCYNEKEIALLHNIADVSVMPGDVGLSVIHSLTYGVPMVTHDNFNKHGPEFEAISQGLTGGFYKYGDPNDLARELKYWVNKTSQNRQKTRQQCKKIIEKYYNPNYQQKIICRVISALYEY
jgi:glycosyltransferase involved in cell wall biosynthesis